MTKICTDWETLLTALAEGEMCRIEGFGGDFRFLSNFHPAPLEFERIVYPTAEHAYQAAKTHDRREKELIAALPSPGRAKRYRGSLRSDWNEVKLGVMESIISRKFQTHEDLRQQLCATGHCYLEETNTWNDCFWGVCRGVGENHLGQILMRVRDESQRSAAKGSPPIL